LLGGRRALFLLLGFLGGLLPALVSWGDSISPHRMLMAYPFIALAAGAALNVIPWRRWCLAVSVVVVLVGTVQSVRLYFSPRFWHPGSRQTFDWEMTSLVEALPLQAPVIYLTHVGYFIAPRRFVNAGDEQLTVENWLPVDNRPLIYAFSQQARQLRPFYEHLFGVDRVRAFGRAFLVSLEAGDWSWVRAHGWTYEARCDGKTWRGQVPALFHLFMTFAAIRCDGPVTHTWRGRWEGPPTTLAVESNGDADIEVSGGRQQQRTAEHGAASMAVVPGSEVTITVTRPVLDGAVNAILLERSGLRERIPPWEWVTPN